MNSLTPELPEKELDEDSSFLAGILTVFASVFLRYKPKFFLGNKINNLVGKQKIT
jgi:hypothetical protein